MTLKNRLGIFIAIFSLALYAQSISFDYTVDDVFVIKENNLVHQGFGGILTLLKTDRLFGTNMPEERIPQYRPVPMIIHAVEWQLFPDSPHIYHLINILFYSLTCWLLFMLLCRLMDDEKRLMDDENAAIIIHQSSSIGLVLPFTSALLFAAHPVHTEVADSIKGIDEISCFLFAIISILFIIKFTEKRSLLHLVFGLISFFLCLLSKETGFIFIIVIPLILWVFSKSDFRKISILTCFLAVVAGVYFAIRMKVLESIPKSNIDALYTPYFNSILAAPDWISQKATAFYILLKYILLLIFPSQLSYDYSIAQIPIKQISSPLVLLSIICHATAAIYAILKIRKKDPLAFAILFYLITLAPVSNVFITIYWTMADRFLFVPSLGFCMLLPLVVFKITDYKLNMNTPRWIQLLPLSVTFIIIGLYSLRTLARNPDWKNNLALYSHDVKVAPNCARAHLKYGWIILNDLYPKEKNKQNQFNLLRKAVKEFNTAISIYNNLPIAYFSRGLAYSNMGDYPNAILSFENVIRFSPSISAPNVYCDLGLLYTQTGQYEKAINILDSALKYYPDYQDAYIKKSHTELLMGKNKEAILDCDKLLKLNPNNIVAYVNKGCGYLNLKQYSKALEYLNKGLNIDPTNTDCLHFLGITYEKMGDTINAEKYYKMENELSVKK